MKRPADRYHEGEAPAEELADLANRAGAVLGEHPELGPALKALDLVILVVDPNDDEKTGPRMGIGGFLADRSAIADPVERLATVGTYLGAALAQILRNTAPQAVQKIRALLLGLANQGTH